MSFKSFGYLVTYLLLFMVQSTRADLTESTLDYQVSTTDGQDSFTEKVTSETSEFFNYTDHVTDSPDDQYDYEMVDLKYEILRNKSLLLKCFAVMKHHRGESRPIASMMWYMNESFHISRKVVEYNIPDTRVTLNGRGFNVIRSTLTIAKKPSVLTTFTCVANSGDMERHLEHTIQIGPRGFQLLTTTSSTVRPNVDVIIPNDHEIVKVYKEHVDRILYMSCFAIVKTNTEFWSMRIEPTIKWYRENRELQRENSPEFEIVTTRHKVEPFEGYKSISSTLKFRVLPSRSTVFTCEAVQGNGKSLRRSTKLEYRHYEERGTITVCIEQNHSCYCMDPELAFVPYQGIREEERCVQPSKYGKRCDYNQQCTYYDMNSFCAVICQCKEHYVPFREGSAGPRCIRAKPIVAPVNTHLNKDIYKAAMVALSCFVVTIVGLVILFLCNRSFLRQSRRQHGPLDDHFTVHQPNDIFNVTDGLAAMRHVDKPPTYHDVVVQDQLVRGVAPPAYLDAMTQIRTERAASLLANFAINAQMERLARNRFTTPEPTSTNPRSVPVHSSTNESTATSSTTNTYSGVVNPSFESDS